jgi:hypothetical protein
VAPLAGTPDKAEVKFSIPYIPDDRIILWAANTIIAHSFPQVNVLIPEQTS